MRSLLTLVACLWLTTSAAFAAVAQPLSVSIDTAGAHTKSLEHYVAGTPIALDVTAPAGIDSVAVIATGPAGTPERTSLTRGPGSAFSGTLSPAAAGSWSVAFESGTGQIRTMTAPLVLDVIEPEGSSPLLPILGLAAALFALAGAAGFIVLRRSASAAEAAPSRAAA